MFPTACSMLLHWKKKKEPFCLGFDLPSKIMRKYSYLHLLHLIHHSQLCERVFFRVLWHLKCYCNLKISSDSVNITTHMLLITTYRIDKTVIDFQPAFSILYKFMSVKSACNVVTCCVIREHAFRLFVRKQLWASG